MRQHRGPFKGRTKAGSSGPVFLLLTYLRKEKPDSILLGISKKMLKIQNLY